MAAAFADGFEAAVGAAWSGAPAVAEHAPVRSEWQVPYEEKLLTSNGDGVLHDPWRGPGEPSLWTGSVRLAFFLHYPDLDRPLLTPFGEVPLPPPTQRPTRLDDLAYEAP